MGLGVRMNEIYGTFFVILGRSIKNVPNLWPPNADDRRSRCPTDLLQRNEPQTQNGTMKCGTEANFSLVPKTALS